MLVFTTVRKSRIVLSDKKSAGKVSAVELVIALVVLAMVGIAGYAIVRTHKHTPIIAAQTPTVSTNPTASWKSSCDSSAKLCLKYPSTWTLHQQTNQSMGTILWFILDQAGTVNVEYGNVPTADTQNTAQTLDTSNPVTGADQSTATSVDTTNPVSFKVVSITNTTSDAAYKIVGGYVVNSADNIPGYYVLPTSVISSDNLTIGQTTTVAIPLDFTSPTQLHNSVAIGSGPISASAFSAAQATQWFSSSTAQVSLQILESLTSQ